MQGKPCRKRAKQQAAENGDRESKYQYGQIDVNRSELRKLVRMESHDEGTAAIRQGAANRPSQQSEGQIFDYELPNQRPLRGADCHSHRDFARAAGIPCQQQIRNVRTCNEEDQKHRAH